MKTFTADDLKDKADKFQRMIDSGLRIPAPWKHYKIGPQPESQLTEQLTSTDPDSRMNAGWWERLWQDEDGTLTGELNVPLEQDSERVGTTVTEVSPTIRDWVDGQGKEWPDSIYHIALVTHPVAQGQENFKRVPDEVSVALSLNDEPGLVVSLSDLKESTLSSEGVQMATEETPTSQTPVSASGAGIKEALAVLKKVGLVLPDDTTPENLLERIVIAGTAAAGVTEEEEPTNQGTPKEQPTPIAMSVGEPNVSDKLLSFATKQAKTEYERRIKALVDTGRIAPKSVTEKLNPLLEGFQLSLDEETGEPNPTQLDTVLDVLEALPEGSVLSVSKSKTAGTPKNKSGVAMSVEEELPTPETNQITDEQADKLAKAQMNRWGVPNGLKVAESE